MAALIQSTPRHPVLAGRHIGIHQRADGLAERVVHCQAERLAAISSVHKYRDCFRAWIGPWLGDCELASLTRGQVLDMRSAMVARNLSAARQYSVLMCLKSFLGFCRRVLGTECLDPADIKLPRRPEPQVEYRLLGRVSRLARNTGTSSLKPVPTNTLNRRAAILTCMPV